MTSPLLEVPDLINKLCDLNSGKITQITKIGNLNVFLSNNPTSVIHVDVDNRMEKFFRLRPPPKSTWRTAMTTNQSIKLIRIPGNQNTTSTFKNANWNEVSKDIKINLVWILEDLAKSSFLILGTAVSVQFSIVENCPQLRTSISFSSYLAFFISQKPFIILFGMKQPKKFSVLVLSNINESAIERSFSEILHEQFCRRFYLRDSLHA